jgi:hypothetical protein
MFANACRNAREIQTLRAQIELDDVSLQRDIARQWDACSVAES